jgi:adenosylcobinamide-phosphate synthase
VIPMIQESLAVFLLAVAFDILLGEPPARIHPVVWIGRFIAFLRTRAGPSRIHGFALAFTVIAVSVLAGHFLVYAASAVPFLPLLVAAYLFKSTFAIRCLLEVSRDIGRMIDQDMDDAKKMLPALVGRDTASLTRTQASSAVIESLEAAIAFKAISTMDSMLGYKTRGLLELGYAGARLDDLANFIPARLSIIFIALAHPARASMAIRAAFQYHNATPSPNSGWPMAAAAGALGIRLEKPGYYVLLEDGKETDTTDVPRALRLMQAVIALTLAAALMVLFYWALISGSRGF